MSTIPFSRKEKHDDKPSEEIQESIHTSEQEEKHDDKPSEVIQESIHIYEHEMNINQGSEFLDDRIRMKDQPLCETTVRENK